LKTQRQLRAFSEQRRSFTDVAINLASGGCDL
jgi:hypothetical protein